MNFEANERRRRMLELCFSLGRDARLTKFEEAGFTPEERARIFRRFRLAIWVLGESIPTWANKTKG